MSDTTPNTFAEAAPRSEQKHTPEPWSIPASLHDPATEIERLRAELAEVKSRLDWFEQSYTDKEGTLWYGTNGQGHCALVRAFKEVKADRAAMVEDLKWAISKTPQQMPDHACDQCVPNGPMTGHGFICRYHRIINDIAKHGGQL